MKSGFVNIFGNPNAGKSTLLNAIVGEKLAIVTPKVQTTRHRIKGIVTGKDYQIVFSDTPGIIIPRYKLQEKMMNVVSAAVEDADVMLLLHDLTTAEKSSMEVFSELHSTAPSIVVLNKRDAVKKEVTDRAALFFRSQGFENIIPISAQKGENVRELISLIVNLLPEGDPFYDGNDLTDLPVRFFVEEIIREKIYNLFEEEIPYQSTVLLQEYTDKQTLTKIRADIIVQRETQKAIILGHRGQMIKKLGTLSRNEIESFIGRKVFLELFVKVRNNWRGKDSRLREYGYG